MENGRSIPIPPQVLLLCYEAEQARALSALLPLLLVKVLLGKMPTAPWVCFDEDCGSNEDRREWAGIFKKICHALDLKPEDVLREMYDKRNQDHGFSEAQKNTIAAILEGEPHRASFEGFEGCAFISTHMINTAIQMAAQRVMHDGTTLNANVINITGDPPTSK